MKLIQLRAFCSVVDRGSFRSAARELDAAQSTLTESVQSLERELGVTLLVRSNQGISLTLAGKVFLTRARSIILDCDRAVQDVRQWNGTPEGQIALGVTAEPMAACLMPVFNSFTRRFPNVQLHVASGKTRMLIEMIRACVTEPRGEPQVVSQLQQKEDEFTFVSSAKARADPWPRSQEFEIHGVARQNGAPIRPKCRTFVVKRGCG